MEMEIVLFHLYQSFAILDLKVMVLEAVFQLYLKLLQLVQVNISLMEKETVFQIKIQKYLVQVDSPLTDKEIVFGFQYLLILHTILQFQQPIKYLHQLQPQSQHHHIVNLDSMLMDLEIVYHHQYQ